MVVLNVLGFRHIDTDHYVCYCYETGHIGLGDGSRDFMGALNDLDNTLKETIRDNNSGRNQLLSREVLRGDVYRMFSRIFFGKDASEHEPFKILKSESGHELHLYHFPGSYVERMDESREVVGELMKYIDEQRNLSNLEKVEDFDVDDIPF